MQELEKYVISHNVTLRTSMKKMYKITIPLLVVVNDSQEVIGVVTDGDFRRAILKDISLEENICKIVNRNFKFLEKNFTNAQVLRVFDDPAVIHVPVLENRKLIGIKAADDYFKTINRECARKKLDIPVVIMAGGRGSRLDPFTRILPKPLLPIGNIPLIELIMDEYAKFGMTTFYITLNHKAKMIKAFFEDSKSGYRISYINENKPLGTAGSIRELWEKIDSIFFVSNCDVIIKTDYTQIVEYHLKGNFELTLVASMQHHTVPYGICILEDGGNLKEIREKPEYDCLANTGMYLLNSSLIKSIPKNTFFHITDLINDILNQNSKIGVYPVLGNDWIDVGQWEEYNKALKALNIDY